MGLDGVMGLVFVVTFQRQHHVLFEGTQVAPMEGTWQEREMQDNR